jgi:hypothetical protein
MRSGKMASAARGAPNGVRRLSHLRHTVIVVERAVARRIAPVQVALVWTNQPNTPCVRLFPRQPIAPTLWNIGGHREFVYFLFWSSRAMSTRISSSAGFGDGASLLMANAIQIALNYLERAGEIDDYAETCQFLADKIEAMIMQGQCNRLVLANRAIAAFQRYRTARTIEHPLAG